MLHKLSICLLASAALTGISVNTYADIHDPQNTYLNRDLPSDNDAATVLNNYLDAVVTRPYSISNPANLTFDSWQTRNGFNSQAKLNAEYYNSADLGLGRDMNCVAQPHLEVQRGAGAMACYVSNHGKIGGGAQAAFEGLNTNNNEGNSPFATPFATVAMEYWPNPSNGADKNNKVRFFVFADVNPNNAGFELVTGQNIVLDNGLGHAQPGLCLSCHGGKITQNGANIVDTHFLPFDTYSFEFETPEKRQQATPIFDKMNKLVYKAEKNAYPSSAEAFNQQIWKYLEGSYPGGINSSTSTLVDSYTPPEFINDQELYHAIAKPYCRGCHLASPTFGTTTLTPALMSYACENNGMPHAEVNDANFLRHMEFIAPMMDTLANTDACYAKPTLIDFQTDLIANPAFRVEGFEQKLTGDIIKHANAGPSDTPENAPERFAAPQLNDEQNTQRRVLVEDPTSIGKAINITKLRGQRAITQVDLIGRQVTNTQPPKAPNFSVIGKDDNGFGIANRPATINNNIDNLVPNFFTSSISVASNSVENIDIRNVGCASALSPNRFCVMEIDDILIYANKPSQESLMFDFEDYPLNPYLDLDGGFNTVIITEGCADRVAVDIRFGREHAFNVNNQLKVHGDSGRYSLQTPSAACQGDLISFTLDNIWGNKLSANTLVEVSFDFSYHLDAIHPLIDGNVQRSLKTLALQNNSYIENNTIASGHVKFVHKVGQDNRLNAKYLKQVGLEGQPIKGLAIDNIVATPIN